MSPKDSEIRQKGELGESALNEWFHTQGLSYVHISQGKETFAPLFRDSVKRPDFLLLLESIGLIAVDAKNYTLSRGGYTLKLEEEVRSVLTFERLFRIPVWYAYLNQEDPETWFWISALKAIEVGNVRINRATQEQFLAISLQHFECVKTNADLGKLYTHRLSGYDFLKNI